MTRLKTVYLIGIGELEAKCISDSIKSASITKLDFSFQPQQKLSSLRSADLFIMDYLPDHQESILALKRIKNDLVTVPSLVLYPQNAEIPESDTEGLIFIEKKASYLDLIKKFYSYLTGTKSSSDKFNSIFQNSPDVIFIVDSEEGSILNSNQIVRNTLGYEPSELIGTKYSTLLPESTESDEEGVIYGGVVESPGLLRKDGTLCPMEITWSIIDWEGKTAIMSTFRDISERKNAEKIISFMAYHDSLTGLPNRLQLVDILNQRIKESNHENPNFAVLFIDLDRFKTINDTLGHEGGDSLIKEVALRLQTAIRTHDTVSRLGGDEFVIVLNQINNEEHAKNIADKIQKIFLPPFSIQERDIYITASIGISLYPGDAQDFESTLKNADMAMYLAKDLGRNNFQFYTDELNRRAQHRLELENDLRKALENDEFFLMYQPVVDPIDNRIVSSEALIRWKHPVHGLRMPSQFIPLAEEIGLISYIGYWVLEEACRQNVQWKNNASTSPISIAVNISGIQFKEKDFVSRVENILKKTSMNPKFLELELTESILMDNIDESIEKLKKLHEHGISISVDDFGTGYSSLNYIRKFPLDILKIDRSFVHDIGASNEGGSIVRAIISLAQNLGLDVIAEGIETKEQLTFLSSLNCRKIQGYFFHHPEQAGTVEDLLIKSAAV